MRRRAVSKTPASPWWNAAVVAARRLGSGVKATRGSTALNHVGLSLPRVHRLHLRAAPFASSAPENAVSGPRLAADGAPHPAGGPGERARSGMMRRPGRALGRLPSAPGAADSRPGVWRSGARPLSALEFLHEIRADTASAAVAAASLAGARGPALLLGRARRRRGGRRLRVPARARSRSARGGPSAPTPRRTPARAPLAASARRSAASTRGAAPRARHSVRASRMSRAGSAGACSTTLPSASCPSSRVSCCATHERPCSRRF